MSVPFVTFPIFLPGKVEMTFDSSGSGVAVCFKGRSFIVTAAHVNGDEYSTNLTLIAQSPEKSSLQILRGQRLMPIPSDSSLLVDLCVIAIGKKTADGLRSTGVTFIGFDNMCSPKAAEGNKLLFTGYRGIEQHQFPALETGVTCVDPVMTCIWTTQESEKECQKIGRSTENFLVGRFQQPATRDPAKPGFCQIENNGMSGGAVWVLQGDQFFFAGISAGQNKDGDTGHLIATRTTFLKEMFTRAIGEFREPV